MTGAFLTALEKEIGELEEALRGDLRYARLTELRRVLDLYRSPSYPGVNVPSAVTAASEAPRVVRRRVSPEREKITDAAKDYLRERSEPVPTREIYEYLQMLGIDVPGEVPQNNLSAMLSNSSEFLSQGRSGWLLRAAVDPVDDDIFDDVAETVVADLSSWELNDLQPDLQKGEPIPSAIDARLLGIARARIHRELEPSEKRTLRSAFKRAVERSTPY